MNFVQVIAGKNANFVQMIVGKNADFDQIITIKHNFTKLISEKIADFSQKGCEQKCNFQPHDHGTKNWFSAN